MIVIIINTSLGQIGDKKGWVLLDIFHQLMHINTETASHASWNCFHSINLLSILEGWKSICCWVGKLGPYYCFNWHLAFNWLRTKNWITQTLIGKRSGIFYVYVQLNLGVFLPDRRFANMKQVWSSRSIPDPCRGPETHLSHPRICVTMKLVAARCQKIFMDVVISIVLFRFGNL